MLRKEVTFCLVFQGDGTSGSVGWLSEYMDKINIETQTPNLHIYAVLILCFK